MDAATKYVLRASAVCVGLFGVLRLPWTEAHIVLPITQLQAGAADRMFGLSAAPIAVTLACSGTDAIALCAAAIAAYPATNRMRAWGLAAGAMLLLGLNTVRIGTLGRAAESPALFSALHLYIWPAVLCIAVAAYVFGWMQLANALPRQSALLAGAPLPIARFAAFALLFLLIFVAAAPLYLDNGAVLALAHISAQMAGGLLRTLGVRADVAGNLLTTAQGSFLVTQECIATPMIPIYFAAVAAYAPSRRRAALGLAIALPLFVALGAVRLIVVALPSTLAGSLFFVHAFFQLLTGAVLVAAVAVWRHGLRAAPRYIAAGLLVGTALIAALTPASAHLLQAQLVRPLSDPQGAIALLPAFQAGLYAAFWTASGLYGRWRSFLAGFAVLALLQAAAIAVLHVAALHVRDIRGWAVAGPLVIFCAVMHVERTRQ